MDRVEPFQNDVRLLAVLKIAGLPAGDHAILLGVNGGTPKVVIEPGGDDVPLQSKNRFCPTLFTVLEPQNRTVMILYKLKVRSPLGILILALRLGGFDDMGVLSVS